MSGGGDGGRRVTWAVAALVALVCLVPFVRILLLGESLYFRDLARDVIPSRTLAVDGLRHGELRYWNPLLREGEPVARPPLAYPPDALQALLQGPWGVTLLLVLHIPLAGLGLFALARALALSRTAAAGAGLLYALGGYALSTLCRAHTLEAVAWTPFAVLALWRAAESHWPWRLAAILCVALLASTGAVEVFLQALVLAAVLVLRRRQGEGGWRTWPGRVVWPTVALALGLGLAAPALLPVRERLDVLSRGSSLAAHGAAVHSIHPFSFVQILTPGLYGDALRPVDVWWGAHHFPRGFPDHLSLYLGATALALAWTGLWRGLTPRRSLLVLMLVAAFVCLGQFAGLTPVFRLAPLLALFHAPAEAFLSIHLGVALLAAYGLDAPQGSAPSAWRSLALTSLGLGLLLVLGPRLAPVVFPEHMRWFVGAFFPDGVGLSQRLEWLAIMMRDATLGGGLALLVAGVAVAAALGRLRREPARLLILGLLAVDLLRAGVGLNPIVPTAFYELSPEMSAVVAAVREGGGRVYTCSIEASPAYRRERTARGLRAEPWATAMLLETLTAPLNILARVPAAASDGEGVAVSGCRRFDLISGSLRAAAVTHVISLDALDSAELRLEHVVVSERLAPVAVLVYALVRPLPRAFVARALVSAREAQEALAMTRETDFPETGRVALEGLTTEVERAAGEVTRFVDAGDRLDVSVDTDGPTALVVRDTWAEGWSARVNGTPCQILRANGRYRAVLVPTGTSAIVFEYRAPGLDVALHVAATAGSLALVLLLVAWWLRLRAGRVSNGPSSAT